MGIRVHKTVGYGCRGFTPSKEVAQHLILDESSIRDLAKWAKKHKDEILALPVKRSVSRGLSEAKMLDVSISIWEKAKDYPTAVRYIYECRAWDDEFGIKDAILFMPPESAQSWKRYDDFIDYHEETGGKAKQQFAYFKRLKCGLYPYRRGEVPLSIGAVLLYSGLGDLWPKLRESLYVWWG